MTGPAIVVACWKHLICLTLAFAAAPASAEHLPAAVQTWGRPVPIAPAEQLSPLHLVEAAFLAAGQGDTSDRARLRVAFADLCRQLDRRQTSGDDYAAVFAFLHAEVLRGDYRANCNTVAETLLQSGDFNCVTATLLYAALLRHRRLPAFPAAIPGHVICILPGERFVETTSPQGMDRNTTAEQSPRKLSDAALVAKIYYNRGVSQLDGKHFVESLAAFQCSISLDPEDSAARHNLLAAINNGALALSDSGRYADALAWVQYGLNVSPQDQPLLANDLYIHQRYIRQLCRQGQYDSALAILEKAYARRPQEPLFSTGRLEVQRRQAAEMP